MRPRQISVVLCLLLLSACANHAPVVRTKLDPTTAVTITYSRTPFLFYRDDTGKAAFARSFIHLAPLQINRSGHVQYYLWLGIWSTLQDTRSESANNSFESIVIFANGEPLLLDLSGRTPAAIGAGESVYIKPVSTAADAYYEVTTDQLRVIADAADIRLQLMGADARTFELWDEQQLARSSLQEFVSKLAY